MDVVSRTSGSCGRSSSGRPTADRGHVDHGRSLPPSVPSVRRRRAELRTAGCDVELRGRRRRRVADGTDRNSHIDSTAVRRPHRPTAGRGRYLMRETSLGKSGLQVSRIAFGTWQLGGDWGATEDDRALAAIRRAADRGVTLFDTAQGYGFGASERFLAKALSSYPREEVVIATKGGLRPTARGVSPATPVPSGSGQGSTPAWRHSTPTTSICTRCTGPTRPRRWRRRRVHWASSSPRERSATSVSRTSTRTRWTTSATVHPVETLQPPYHLLRRGIERGHPAVRQVPPHRRPRLRPARPRPAQWWPARGHPVPTG